MSRDSFPDGVVEQINWYVYRLIDPRNGETFYVGKGRGDRVFAHAKGQPAEVKQDDIMDMKTHRIRDIRATGLEVGHVIHRHGLGSPKVAFEVEAAVIDAYPGLTNQANGHGSGDYGSRHVEEIIAEYAGEEFEVKEDLILISIGIYYYLRDNPYDAVRYVWRLNENRAKKIKLVLARLRGMVVGAYRPDKWLRGTRENFPDLANRYDDFEELPELLGFVGKPAEDVWNDYVGKRVPERFPRGQNAIRYLNKGM